MSKISYTVFERPYASTLAGRLAEPRRFIQVIAGARQVGKTTLVEQVVGRLSVPVIFVTADSPTPADSAWLTAQWERARMAAADSGNEGVVLVLDEAQKIVGWSETVKKLWDEDSRKRRHVKVVVLGSSPLLLHHGLTESLAGRFEVLHLPHWSYTEMREAFGYSIEDYLYFGGYPGVASLKDDVARWRRYIIDSLIETTISRDVLLMTRVDKPALLRRLFQLGSRYSGQVLSYTKMLGQLQDAGNTVTLAHYLDLLSGAGILTGIQKYCGHDVRRRASSPKLQVMNTALMTAQSGLSPAETKDDHELYGRLVESAVGAHLSNAAAEGKCDLFYWREGNNEVDFVIRSGKKITAIEVKSGDYSKRHSGLAAFSTAYKSARLLMVGGDGIPLDEFMSTPVEKFVSG